MQHRAPAGHDGWRGRVLPDLGLTGDTAPLECGRIRLGDEARRARRVGQPWRRVHALAGGHTVRDWCAQRRGSGRNAYREPRDATVMAAQARAPGG